MVHTRLIIDYDDLGRLRDLQILEGSLSALIAQLSWKMPADGVPRVQYDYRGKQGEQSSVFEVDGRARLLSETHQVTGTDSITFLPHQPVSQANKRVSKLVASTPSWQAYQLDGRGNWLDTTTDAGSYENDLNQADEYLSFGGLSAQYDARGALLSIGGEVYEWDSFGKLRSAEVGSESREYVHDALGRTVGERDTDGNLTWYGYDGMHRVVRHRDGIGTDYTIDGLGPDEHYLRLTDGSAAVDYFHQDRMGSIIAISSAQTATSIPKIKEWAYYTAYGEQSLYDPNGNPIAASAVDNHFGFQGHRQDHSIGLVDMRARMYRPGWGRFLNRDPIGLAGGNNQLAFVGSAPLMYTDPMGLDKLRAERLGQLHGLIRSDVMQARSSALLAGPTSLDRVAAVGQGAWGWTSDGVVGGLKCFVQCDSIELFKDFSDSTVNTILHPVDAADAASDALSDAAYTMHHGSDYERGQILAELFVAFVTRKMTKGPSKGKNPGAGRADAAKGGVATPWGVAQQGKSGTALAARAEVNQGATLYRIGTTGKSNTTGAQFWALEHPSTPGFASRYGIPPGNVSNANFVQQATLKPGTNFVTRQAPPVGSNVGGGIEVVVPENGVVFGPFSTL